MELATLRTGKEVPAQALMTTTLLLQKLARTEADAFFELVEVCRKPGYKLSQIYAKRLQECGLIQGDGQPHEYTREIVLASAEGEELDLKLVSPVKQPQSEPVQHSILVGSGPFTKK